jgi:hypothetical protein
MHVPRNGLLTCKVFLLQLMKELVATACANSPVTMKDASMCSYSTNAIGSDFYELGFISEFGYTRLWSRRVMDSRWCSEYKYGWRRMLRSTQHS